ncbi:MAG TPA: peptidoglycan-associated lipoprotein Pal [Kiloniellales bacterium]|nr:peptidoglycan-associated lipoprotein Pal [Kiloniellales bacterium]
MKFKVVTVAAAALLLAACSTTPRDQSDADASASGGAMAGTSQQGLGSAAPGTQEELRQTIGDRIFFDFDSYSVRPDQRRTVEQVAQWMNQHQNVQLTVEGHADERGTREYNLALGDRRANSVREMLQSYGVPASRLSSISYGKERPDVLGSNEYAWEQNRRAVFAVR